MFLEDITLFFFFFFLNNNYRLQSTNFASRACLTTSFLIRGESGMQLEPSNKRIPSYYKTI